MQTLFYLAVGVVIGYIIAVATTESYYKGQFITYRFECKENQADLYNHMFSTSTVEEVNNEKRYKSIYNGM